MRSFAFLRFTDWAEATTPVRAIVAHAGDGVVHVGMPVVHCMDLLGLVLKVKVFQGRRQAFTMIDGPFTLLGFAV